MAIALMAGHSVGSTTHANSPSELATAPSLPHLASREDDEAGAGIATNQPNIPPARIPRPSTGQFVRSGVRAGQIPRIDDEFDESVVVHLTSWQPKCRVGWRTYDSTNLPGFIKPLTVPLPPGTVEFLEANEAFSFPANHATRSALVNGFIRAVQPIYPMLELDNLIQLASQAPVYEIRARFSLLTFQAILLAAIPVGCVVMMPLAISWS